MKKLLTLFISCLIFLGITSSTPVFAADIRSGEDVTISSTATDLKDLYLFGGAIRVDAPVQNDIVAAGGNITISKPVTGSAIVAGGNITINAPVGNTVRAAGGNIIIDGPVARDLVITGGSVQVTKNAAVNGDLIFTGGKLNLEGPVKGKAVIRGGEIVLNSSMGGDVYGEVGKLTLGPQTQITGNLTYKSPEKAQIAQGASIRGKTNYTQVKTEENKDTAKAFVTAGTIYKLIADILLSILLIYFFTRGLTIVLNRMVTKPIESGAIGFAFIFLFPIAAFIAFILIWLGISALLIYGLTLLISIFIVKIFLGWFIMRWWENRDKKHYILDWKAGLIGPIILFLINLIPFIGWLASALLLFIATGAFVVELTRLMSGQKVLPSKAVAKKK